jgi:dephospho-CoA kinase
MLKIGLTGGIGSGKSTVAKVFELLNIPVYYADTASKVLYHSDKELMGKIKKHFGEDVYTNDVLNKATLASRVFDQPRELEYLNSLVHPLTIKDANDWMNLQKAPYVIKEAALIFESGSASELDYIIGVRAPLHIRLKRVMDRDEVTREEVISRINRQISETIKMKLCDFIIENDEQTLVIPQVLILHQLLLQKTPEIKKS